MAESVNAQLSDVNLWRDQPGTPPWPVLVCPEDHRQLAREDGVLICSAGHRWPVEDGIPRMVTHAHNYADAFGLQWKTYRRTQLDSYCGTPFSRDRARRCFGEDGWAALHGQCLNVLEVGCGAGRFTEILLSSGAKVTSVDFSSAVEANQENFSQSPYHRIVQGDVTHLPFVPGQYDAVFCLGVIQHTPNPELTIQKLYEQLKPGGCLVIDHYTYTLSEFTKSGFLVRMILIRVSPTKGLEWSRRLVDVFLPLHKAVRRHVVLQALLSRVSPILSYYHALPLNDDLQREWALLDTHDFLTDRYKHFRTKNQIARQLKALGAESTWCDYGGNGVEARCKRPVGPKLAT